MFPSGTAIGAFTGCSCKPTPWRGKNLLDGIEGLLTGYNDEYRKQAAENAKLLKRTQRLCQELEQMSIPQERFRF